MREAASGPVWRERRLLDLSGCHWPLVTEARVAAQHPTGHRRAPLHKELSNPNVSGAGVGEPHEPRGYGRFGGRRPVLHLNLQPRFRAAPPPLFAVCNSVLPSCQFSRRNDARSPRQVSILQTRSTNRNEGNAPIASESRCPTKMIFENSAVCVGWKMNIEASTRRLQETGQGRKERKMNRPLIPGRDVFRAVVQQERLRLLFLPAVAGAAPVRVVSGRPRSSRRLAGTESKHCGIRGNV